jgi:phytoene desaturase
MRSSTPEKAIVIGSGFGGLAAALRLRALGYEVEVWERGVAAGGRASVFEKDGFTYDAGPTVITAPFLFDDLFALFGEKREDHLEFLPVKPWYRMVDGNQRTFDYGGTEEEVRHEIAKFNPADAEGYGKMLEHSRMLYDEGFTRLGAQPFDRLSTMVRCVPALLRLRGDLTVWQFVCRYLKDDSLRRFFSIQPLLVGGNPFTTPSLYSLIHYLEIKSAIWYPRGGTGQLVKSLVELAERQGVHFRYNTTVEEIEVKSGRVAAVRAVRGGSEACDLVVANSDTSETYRRLIAPVHRKKWTDKRLDRLHYSMGLFVLYFGTDTTFPEVAHHTILFSERYRELLNDIFKDGKLADDPSLYLHRPTATDPEMAPPGRDAFYVLAPVPNLKTDIDWEEVGPRYAELILEQLEHRVMPNLRKHVVSQFFVTPKYFRDSLLSAHGAGFSISPLLTQSAWFRFHNKSEDVAGLYFVGAGTHPGAGLPGVVLSAKVVENLLRDEAGK